MITVRPVQARRLLTRVGARLRRRPLAEVGWAGWALAVADWAAGILRHQCQEARLAAPRRAPAIRDRHGRRLRASAYRHGLLARSRRAAGAHGPVLRLLPTALRLPVVAVIALLSFVVSSQLYVAYAGQLPDAHLVAAPLPEDTLVYAADGSLLADLHEPGAQHYYESLDQMGKWLPLATVDVEDANFFNEPGLDLPGIVRAAWVDWRLKEPVQGASTITQQLVKLRVTGNQPTLDRKLKEALLALEVEQSYTKGQILEQYLNTVFYANNAQGSLAAARIYFHRETPDLDLAQASMLAGIPRSPLHNDPFTHWSTAKQRQRQVLNALVRHHDITAAQADQAYAEDLRPPDHMFTAGPQVLAAPGFVSWIAGQLTSRYGTQGLLDGGLRVTTTLDPRLQRAAEQAVVSNVDANRYHGLTQGAMVAIDPRSGAVRAMVGSAYPDQDGGQYDLAVWPPRNPGSSMKIYTYTAAIESGRFTMVTKIPDTPLVVSQGYGEPPYQPKNYDGGYHGICQFQACIGNSLNVPAVKVELSIGVDRVVDMARRMGAPPWVPHADGTYADDDPASSYGASLTLGGYGETPLQMATGAATLADNGVRHQPYGITSIVNSRGLALTAGDPRSTARQVIDPRVAYIMQTILSDDNNRALIFGRGGALTLPDRRVAAKTGTTDDFRDAWTVGFTPRLASAFWFGNPDNTPLYRGGNIDAIYIAAPAWHDFMNSALRMIGEPAGDWFAEPPGLVHDGGALLLPGTSASQPAPPLPSFARSSDVPPPKPPDTNPDHQGDSG